MEVLDKIPIYTLHLLKGAGFTVGITAGSLLMAVVIGFVFGALTAFVKRRITVLPITLYVEILRGLPPLAVLFILYFGLAYTGLRLEPLTAAILGLGTMGGAMLTEVFRAGFIAIHIGQREAALAVGMTPMMVLRHIILPQTWRITLPPLGNYAIGLLKDTAIVSAIAAPEIMFYARNLVTTTFDTTLIYILVAIVYFCMSFPLARLVARFERQARVA